MLAGLRLNAKGPARGELLIYQDIGEGFFTSGITAQGFLQDLKALGDITSLDVRINSNGGSVFDGIAIYNALRRHPAQKNVFVDGIAASIASVIAMAGDTRTMGEGTFLMVHRASGLAVGNAEDMRSVADVLEGLDGQIADIYSSRTGLDTATITQLMTDETWLNAEDAIGQGFADSMGESLKIAAHVAAGRFHNVPPSLRPANHARTPRLDAYRARYVEVTR